jgi:rhodanese-related sulfurtransferase
MRKMMLCAWLLPIALLGLNPSVLATDQPADPPQNITPSHISGPELLQIIQQGESVTIIDVRSEGEYNAGHVPGAIHMSFWKAWFRASDLAAPRDQTLVVYCAHGPRAWIGKGAFILAGFEDIRYLDGHMSSWVKAKLPVERSPKR